MFYADGQQIEWSEDSGNGLVGDSLFVNISINANKTITLISPKKLQGTGDCPLDKAAKYS